MSYKTPKLLKKKRIIFYSRIALWIIFAITLLGGTSFWSYQPFFQIDEFTISETRFVEKNSIVNAYAEESAKSFLMMFSKNTIFSLPKNQMIKRIFENPSVKYVQIKTNSINSISFEITEHQPTAVFCKEENCYFVNDEGKFFTKTDRNYPDQLIVIEANNIEGELLGQNFSNPETFKKIMETIEFLKKIDITINKIFTEDFETFNLVTGRGPRILIEKNDDPETVVNNLKTTLEQEDIHDRQFENLEYFDLRFEDKVYYKIK